MAHVVTEEHGRCAYGHTQAAVSSVTGFMSSDPSGSLCREMSGHVEEQDTAWVASGHLGTGPVEKRWIAPNVITRRKQSGWNAPPGMLMVGKVFCVWRQKAYEKSLYFPLRLAVNIKLL